MYLGAGQCGGAVPDFSYERAAKCIVAGVDEAGRGPLAGPVVAAAVILDRRRIPRGIDDSKKLAREDREVLYAKLTSGAHAVAVGAASVNEIDILNILQATMLAMRRAVARLPVRPELLLIDGDRAPIVDCATRTVIGGDALCLSIAAASIIAKVVRDRAMRRLAPRYPQFGWHSNVGYAVDEHRAALTAVGPTRHHRRSFRLAY
jgi:ribonuclease HII